MNDRFKFRVWDKYIQSYIKENLGEKCVWIEDDGQLGAGIDDSYILEQCTGLKDKNGNLIYEGDIVKIPNDWSEYGMSAGSEKEVYFYDGGFRFKPTPEAFERGCRGNWMEDVDGVLEIVGNIHENKSK